MAAKKTATGTKKPAASKKTAQTQKSSATAKKTSQSRGEQTQAMQQAHRQQAAIWLFAAAVLLFFLALIPGQKAWAYLHHGLFSLFGVCAWAIPLILAALAVVFAINRPLGGMKSEFICAAIFVVILSGIVHVGFRDWAYLADNPFQDQITDAVHYDSIVKSGGILGVLVGYSLAYLFGKVPAMIVMVLALFISFMLFSGTTLVALYKAFAKPVKKVGSMTDARIEQGMRRREEMEAIRAERRQQREEEKRRREEQLESQRQQEKKKALDIALGPEAAPRAENADGEPFAAQPGASNGTESPAPVRKKNKYDVPIAESTDESVPLPEEPPVIPISEVEPITSEMLDMPKPTRRKKAQPELSQETAQQEAQPESPDKLTEDFEVPIVGEAQERTYRKPPLSCLSEPVYNSEFGGSQTEIDQNSAILLKTLESFGVRATITGVFRGPSVTRYELLPAEGVKISKITNLADDIALRLAASGVRIEAPIPNKAAIGIEVPNRAKASVTLREIIDTDVYRKGQAKSILSVALGKDIAGNVICADLAKMPHLLIAGTTGSGKSVCVNSMIMSILYNADPNEVKLLMIDPKQVEFTVYSGIPHLLVPVVSDPRKASGALNWAVTEMLDRYKKFSDKNVRDITGYNKLADRFPEVERMNRIVIFIDELSDLMMVAQSEVEDAICRLAQMARAAGMHLVIATQRPSVDVITGLIKANIPSRIALSVSSQIDSRTIIDMAGAEKLLGYGDMLFNPVGMSKPLRVQGCFVSDSEVEQVVDFIKSQEQSDYSEEIMDEIERQSVSRKKGGDLPAESEDGGAAPVDEKLQKAIEIVVEAQMASTTLLQRKLSLGYARAARLIDELEERKIVGPFEGSKPRKVLINKQQWMEMCALSSDTAPQSAETDEDEVADEPPFDTDEESV